MLKVHAMCEDTCIESWVENMDGDTVDFVDAEFARGLEREIEALRRKYEPHQQPCPCAWCRVEEENKAAQTDEAGTSS